MRIKVLKNIIASKDKSGCFTMEYKKGETYEIYEELALSFIKNDWGINIGINENHNMTFNSDAVIESQSVDHNMVEIPEKKIKKKKHSWYWHKQNNLDNEDIKSHDIIITD